MTDAVPAPADRVGPLAGVRVLDLGHWWAAPMASMLLADQGAEVIRVVRPDSDEPAQRWFVPLHRNKQIVRIDLAREEGRTEAHALAGRADVVIESFRPGVMARHGLDGATLSARHPHLVHLSLPGFASVDEERADLPGWEGIIAAAMGLFTTGLAQGLDRPPVFHAVPIPSAFAAAHGAIAVVAALHRRRTRGGGAVLEVPLAHAALAACSRSFCFAGHGVRSTATRPRAVPPGAGGEAPPNYSIHHYRSADGRRLLVMPIKPEMIGRYLRVLGLETEVIAAGYVNHSPWNPVTNPAEANLASSWTMSAEKNRWLIDRIEAVVATRTAEEWIRLFTEARIPCAAMGTRDDWLQDPANTGSGLVVSLDPTDGNLIDGDLSMVGRFADVDSPEAPPLRFEAPSRTTAADARDRWDDDASSTAGPPAETKSDLLAGVRVLDLCNVVAGPNAGYVFAQLGADVIRIEPSRSFNLPMHHAWTLEVNQGKRSAVLDITTQPGRRAFEALVKTVDVVIHNRLDDVAERLGLTAPVLREVNPDVVVCQISAFGGTVRNGRERQPGYDPHPNLATGLDALLGSPEAPGQAEEILSDLTGGLSGAFAAVCALHQRSGGGPTPSARGSLARGTSFLQAPWMVGPAPVTGWADATGPEAAGFGPDYGLYRSASSWLFLAAPGLDPDRLAALVGADTVATIAAAIAEQPTSFWTDRLRTDGVAVHEVHSIDDLCEHAGDRPVANETADERAVGAIRVVSWPDHPSGVPVVLPEPAWVLVGADRSYRRLAPTPVVGAHTRDILAEAGLSPGEIDELVALRVAHDHLPAMSNPAAYFFEPERVTTS